MDWFVLPLWWIYDHYRLQVKYFFHLLYARWEFEGLPFAKLYAVDMSEFFLVLGPSCKEIRSMFNILELFVACFYEWNYLWYHLPNLGGVCHLQETFTFTSERLKRIWLSFPDRWILCILSLYFGNHCSCLSFCAKILTKCIYGWNFTFRW